MTSMKSSDCTGATKAAYQRSHMPINLTTSSSTYRQQLNKRAELLASESYTHHTSVARNFQLTSTVQQTSYLPESDGWTLNATFQQPQSFKENEGGLPLEWDSHHSPVSLQIQIESVPRRWVESYFYKSENPLRKYGSFSEDISVIPGQSCRESGDYMHCIVKKHSLIPLYVSYYDFSCFPQNADTITASQFISLCFWWSFYSFMYLFIFSLIHYKMCARWTCI